MNKLNENELTKLTWPIIYYFSIVFIFSAFDAFTDRSFGALMLSVLPISLILPFLLIFGARSKVDKKFLLARDFAIGMLLIFTITIIFSSLGEAQSKTGELILNYALLISCAPTSILLPFAIESLPSWLMNEQLTRITSSWLICIGLGWIEWNSFSFLYSFFRGQSSHSEG
jgi:hypothetical protein